MKRILKITDTSLELTWKAIGTLTALLFALVRASLKALVKLWDSLERIDFLSTPAEKMNDFFSFFGDIFRTLPIEDIIERLNERIEDFNNLILESSQARRFFFLIVFALLFLYIYPPSYWPPWYKYQEGKASFYGNESAGGRKTANGETFDPNELTAAHKHLPLGAIVLVRNIENGEEVVVRINDDGPNHPGRIIDLSEAAAEELDFVENGLSRVIIYTKEKYTPGKRYRPLRKYKKKHH